MSVVACPHCGNKRIVTTRVPKDVVVVLPCPECRELVVLFRSRVIAISRRILEHGTFEERKQHLAEIIAQFLEPDMFAADPDGSQPGEIRSERLADDAEADEESLISDEEVERFVKVDLKRLDDTAYFKRHFG